MNAGGWVATAAAIFFALMVAVWVYWKSTQQK